MRTKRDQRPLLTQEAPILSDQMPLGSYEEDRQQQQQTQQQQHLNNNTNNNEPGNGKQQKKRSWRRLFGKGSKRKENQNPQSAALDGAGGLESSQSQSSSSASETVDYSVSQGQQQHRQSSHSGDKRDDLTESSSNHVQELLDNEPAVYKLSMRSPTSSKLGMTMRSSRSSHETAS